MTEHGELSTTAVVTGAAGWLGQNLVRALVPTRDRVRCLVHDADDAPLAELLGENVEVLVGDVRDVVSVDSLFEDVGEATVFHTAAVIHPSERAREFYDVNVGGTELVLDGARRASARRFVHVSSNSPFGANPTPTDRFTEASVYNPYMGYGRSKMEAELIVQRGHDRGDIATVILRAPWFYGPYQPPRQSAFFKAIARGRFPIIGSGSQQRSMVYTDNLVQGLLRAETAASAPGHAYWIADARPYELLEILDTVRTALRLEGVETSDREPFHIPALAGVVAERVDGFLQGRGRYLQAVHVLGELKDTIACDISRAREDLDYDPQIELLDGMRASIRWCLEHGERL
jgi:nucleoside-diphosphate-sugar epimerase